MSINIERGYGEGDPIARYRIILCAQILCYLIIQNKKINFNNTEIKISQYADDTTLILDGQAVSLHAELNTLEIYGTVSGLKVNTDKTQIVWIRKKKHAKEKTDTGKNLVLGNTDFYLLRINFSVELNCMEDMNYNHSIESVKELLNNWKKDFDSSWGDRCH